MSAILRSSPNALASSSKVVRSIPQPAARAFGSSASSAKALPFSLRPGVQRADKDKAAAETGKTLRMIMFGKPGAGKGTLSGRLLKKYDNIVSLSTGDLLRQHIAERTEVGKLAEEIVARGGLLPDEIMLKIVTSKLDALQNKHWILDGFPRTLGQGQLLDAHLRSRNSPLNLIVNLDVPDRVILGRIADRWVHLSSGRVYNLSYNPPKVPGLDDETGEPLAKRPDDNPETFARRLDQFYAATSPLLSHYAAQPGATSCLATVSGETSDEIWPQLDALVMRAFPTLSSGPAPDAIKVKALADVVVAKHTERKPSSNNRARAVNIM